MCPVHLSLQCGCGRIAGAPVVALALASLFALGCASGTGDDPGGLSDPDAACITPGCGVYDAGASFGDAYGAVDTATTDSAPLGHDSGVTSPEDHEVPFDAGVTCALRLPTPITSCNTCLSADCCSQDNACGSDPACLAFNDCEARCVEATPDAAVPDDGGPSDAGVDAGMTACLNECALAYPVGLSLLSALDTCLETTCASPCASLL